MSSYKTTSVFVIRQVATGKLISFGSKCGWATICLLYTSDAADE